MFLSDYILIQGLIYTSDLSMQSLWYSEILIYRDKILSIGPKGFALKYYNLEEKEVFIIKLPQESVLIPGIIDAHSHPLAGSLQKLNCSLKKAKNWLEASTKLTEYIKKNSHLDWFFSSGYEDSWLDPFKPETPLNLLDKLQIEKPLVITRFDGHAFWCNYAAIKQANVDLTTKDPIGGNIGKIQKNGTLELDGLFHDEAMKIIRKSFPKLNQARMQEAYELAIRKMIRNGITCFSDASTKEMYLETYIRNWSDFKQRTQIFPDLKAMPSKICLSWKDFGGKDLNWENLSPENRFLIFEEVRKLALKDNFEIDTIKIFVDGVVESLSAALLSPYNHKNSNGSDNYGCLHYSRQQLMEIITLSRKFGYNLHYHIVGDAAFRLILSCIRENNASTKEKPIKHILAHVQLVDLEDLPLPQNVGLCFSPLWFYQDFSFKATKNELGLKRVFNLYPINYFTRISDFIGLGSDWPVSSMNPFKAIEIAITHLKLDSSKKDYYSIFSPDHKITLFEALNYYTIGSAKICGEERKRGSLEIGKFADLTVLDRNIFEIETTEIHRTKVKFTMIEGKIMYNKLTNSYKI